MQNYFKFAKNVCNIDFIIALTIKKLKDSKTQKIMSTSLVVDMMYLDN